MLHATLDDFLVHLQLVLDAMLDALLLHLQLVPHATRAAFDLALATFT